VAGSRLVGAIDQCPLWRAKERKRDE
jgi:hypothetical protein